MKAAIYIRVSTQLQSTDRQRTELTELANKRGYEVVQIYEDFCSGFKDRASYNQLKEDATKGLFNIVLFSEMSRMTRKNNLLSEVDYFKRNNVQVYFQKQNILVTNQKNDLGSTILLSVMSAISSYEVELMKERLISGKIEQLKTRPMTTGKVPFGYMTSAEGDIKVNPDEAPIIKEAIEKYADGWSTDMLIQWLNANTDKNWYSSTFRRILKRKLYKGIHEVKFSKVAQTTVSNYYPELRIVSDDIWDKCQAKLYANQRGRLSKSYPYHLRHLIVCTCCGRHFTGRTVGGGRHNYNCTGNNTVYKEAGNQCTNTLSVMAEHLDYAIWTTVMTNAIKANNDIDIKAKITQIEAQINDLNIQLGLKKEALNKLNKALTSFAKKAVMLDLSDDEVAQYGADNKREKASITSDIDQINQSIKSQIEQLDYLRMSGDQATLDALLQKACEDPQLRIEYLREHIDIIYIFSIEPYNYFIIKDRMGCILIVRMRKRQRKLNDLKFNLIHHEFDIKEPFTSDRAKIMLDQAIIDYDSRVKELKERFKGVS